MRKLLAVFKTIGVWSAVFWSIIALFGALVIINFLIVIAVSLSPWFLLLYLPAAPICAFIIGFIGWSVKDPSSWWYWLISKL